MVAIVAKTAPTGKVVGDTVNLTDLFTYTDSVAGDYTYTSDPAGGANIGASAITLNSTGNVKITAVNKTTSSITANTTLLVSEPRKGQELIISTDFNNYGYGLTVAGTLLDAFDGTWHVEGSGDGTNWFLIGEEKNASGAFNIDVCMPYIRITAGAGTKGSAIIDAFGPAIRTVERNLI